MHKTQCLPIEQHSTILDQGLESHGSWLKSGSTFINYWGKKSKDYFMTWKLNRIQCPQMQLYWNQPRSFVRTLSEAAFAAPEHSERRCDRDLMMQKAWSMYWLVLSRISLPTLILDHSFLRKNYLLHCRVNLFSMQFFKYIGKTCMPLVTCIFCSAVNSIF